MSEQNLLDWGHLALMTISQGFLLHEVGLLSLGTAGMALAGGYAFAFLALGVHPAVCAVVILTFAVLASAPALRVRGEIFAVVTLALASIGQRFSVGATTITGGSMGLGPLPRPDWLASTDGALVATIVVTLAFAAVYVVVCRSATGVVLGGTRDNELLVRSIGYSPLRIQFLVTFAVALATAAVGALTVSYYGLVTPRMGTLDLTLRALAAAMLARPLWRQGRPEVTILGYLVASGALALLPPALRSLMPDVGEAVLRQILFGSALYILVHPAVFRRLGRA